MDDSLENADETLERAVLARSVDCMQCGYDLRGLSVAGPCPECGCEIWKTVQHVVDPASRLLTQVRHPRKVGNALCLLVGCLLVAAILLFARPAALTIASFGALGVAGPVVWPPEWYAVAPGLVVLAALIGVAQLAPPANTPDAAVRGDLWLLATGHVLLGAAILGVVFAKATLTGGGLPLAVVVAIARESGIVGAVILLIALRRVLRVIGERSREFRTARGGRQRIREMIAAVVGIGIGLALQLASETLANGRKHFGFIDHEALGLVGTVIVWISALMLLIGLMYLVVNAWWIRRALRTPPPTMRELVGGGGGGGGGREFN